MSFRTTSSDDYAAIANMIGAYQHLVDSGDEDGYADLFTEDGAFLGMPEEVGPPDSFRGREGLKRIPRLTMAGYGGKFRHHVGSLTVSYGETQDAAVARYYVLAVTSLQEPKIERVVLVTTQLVRTADGWKIKTNTMRSI
jgi:ketosteroid isomerase-like protein